MTISDEERARTLQELLVAIVEGSDDAIISKDLNRTITSWNKAAERMYGYTAEEAIGRPISMLVPPDQPDETIDILEHIKRGERVDHYETRRMRKDGTILDVSLTVSPIHDAKGDVIGASKIARDITEHKRAQRALQESEARFRQLIETAPIAILIANERGDITLVNDRVTALFGYERDELLGKPAEMLLPEQLHSVHRQHRDGYFTSPSARPMGNGRDLSGRRKDGSKFPVEIGLSHLQTEHGTLALAFVTDITERVELYAKVKQYTETLEQKVAERTQELQEALTLAQSADRAKSVLLSTVSHEMRTPLSSIVGFSNLILSRKPGPEKLTEYVNYINIEARRLTGLINDFLDLQRIEAGRQVFHLAELDLASLIRDEIGKQQLNDNSDQPIRLELEPAVVDADPERIRQVILNLLSNALKYSSGGEIAVSLRTSGNEAIVSVHDPGIGIPGHELDKLFQRFYRGEAAEKQRIRGTGLGLALCREIIAAHDGRIWAESPGPNQGATFSFALPIASSSLPIEGHSRRNTGPQADQPLIVVIEDDARFSLYLAESLGPEGYKVEVLTFEQATVDHIARLNPALIVLDILDGPEQSGWPLLTALKQHAATQAVPVVICSVLNMPRRAWQLGASSYVTKPVDETFLLGEITRLIGPSPRAVLVVDDSEITRALLNETLTGAGYQVQQAVDGQSAIDHLKQGWPDLIVLDLLMPGIDGFGVLEWIRAEQRNLDLPVIAFTAAELTTADRERLSQRASALALKSDTPPQQLLSLIRRILLREN
jgi:PAS domain S-box-containing protein